MDKKAVTQPKPADKKTDGQTKPADKKVDPRPADNCPCCSSGSASCPWPTPCATPHGPWFSAEYLLWWERSAPVNGPLVTTGSLLDVLKGGVPGALGQPHTEVLFGNSPINYGAFSGLRIGGGMDLTPLWNLEAGYFVLEHRGSSFEFASDPNGNPLIGRPVFLSSVGVPGDFATSVPNLWAGNTTITAHTSLQGYEINLARSLQRGDGNRLDLLFGFRALNLNEDLIIADAMTPLFPGILTLKGMPVIPPSTLEDFDRFRTSNNFFGGQVGARWEGGVGQLRYGVTGKIALGTTEQLATIEGASALLTPGAAPVTAPGGVLAQVSNIGRHYRSVFSVVPEAGLTLGWQLTTHLQATLGYNIMYWSNVARPGNQIDHTINPGLPPTGQNFGIVTGPIRPTFAFQSSDFWAQGLTFGIEYRY